MNKRLILLLLPLMGTWSSYARTQEFSAEDEFEPRYQFMVHDAIVDGTPYEIYLKLDRHTGKTWRFHANKGRWTSIPEAKKGRIPQKSNQVRYELLPHEFVDPKGETKELYIRADMLGGDTWMFRGLKASWQEIAQDK